MGQLDTPAGEQWAATDEANTCGFATHTSIGLSALEAAITQTYHEKKRGCAFSAANLMSIHRLIANGSFGPDEIEAMTAAYDAALIELCQPNNDDPITELIAKSIVNVTATGERAPMLIKERAINALGVRRPTAA